MQKFNLGLSLSCLDGYYVPKILYRIPLDDINLNLIDETTGRPIANLIIVYTQSCEYKETNNYWP